VRGSLFGFRGRFGQRKSGRGSWFIPVGTSV
jgi:hypothetical protein